MELYKTIDLEEIYGETAKLVELPDSGRLRTACRSDWRGAGLDVLSLRSFLARDSTISWIYIAGVRLGVDFQPRSEVIKI